MKDHAVYVLREDPDVAVFDLDLLDELATTPGDWQEYDLVGVLPLELEFDADAQSYKVKARDGKWSVLRADVSDPITAQLCAAEIGARAEARRKAKAQVSDARELGREAGYRDGTRSVASNVIHALIGAAEAYHDFPLRDALREGQRLVDNAPRPPNQR